MDRKVIVGIVSSTVFAAVVILTFSTASASGRQDLFNSWKSLISPVMDLQTRVAELEEKNAALEERVAELEERLEDGGPSGQIIIIQLDEIQYDPGDDIAITGQIEDLVTGENEINIQVKGPGISDSENVDLDDTDFDFVYELPNSADDGVYAVRVEYDNNAAYSYFIVDEEANSVLVETVDFYRPGDNVEVFGEVLDPVTGEDFVEITVLDPHGSDVPSGEPAELDAENSFFLEFDLNDDPTGKGSVSGRYAILASYDGAQEGEAIFEVGN